jgi:predicted enzyme related to lactoylglutathione lyase
LPSLRLLVLRSRQIQTLKVFYESLGLKFSEEKHGKGPLHYAATLGTLVLELYPYQETNSGTETTRLGFAISAVEKVCERAKAAGATIKQAPKKTDHGVQALLLDPDGRTVELTQEE